MPDPVVMDDGGSTRIKLISAASGSIDALVDVALSGAQYQSKATVTGPYTQLKILYLDASGTPTPAAGSPFALAGVNSIELTSINQQRVKVKIVNNSGAGGSAADCEITVFAVGGVIPNVESRS